MTAPRRAGRGRQAGWEPKSGAPLTGGGWASPWHQPQWVAREGAVLSATSAAELGWLLSPGHFSPTRGKLEALGIVF